MAGVLSSQFAAAQTPIESVAIDVAGDRITLAPADADAFQRRLDQPPQLETPPAARAPSFVVTTTYWDSVVRQAEREPALDAEGEYFPAGGFVRAHQDGEDVWLVLDLRQRATLDRYIRFGTQSANPASQPGALELIRFASGMESIGIEAGSSPLSDAEARAFWDALAPIAMVPTFSDQPQPPVPQDLPGYWLTFWLPEGRAQQYFLDTDSGLLTDALGTESYAAGDLIGAVLPEAAAASRIEQDDPAGSQFWWFLTVGGAVALLAIAIWTKRGFVQPQ